MSETERREEWLCWQIAHDGDGPGRINPTTQFNYRRTMTAEEAAKDYAYALFDDNPDDYEDGDYVLIGVEYSPKRSEAFRCTKRVKIEVTSYMADWITQEALRP